MNQDLGNSEALATAATSVLCASDPNEKVRRSLSVAEAWAAGAMVEIGTADPPERPARPPRPELRPPREMPKRRRAGSNAARIALLHAVAHIELNAIDLAWDMIARFSEQDMPRAFFDDWVKVGADEARHFRAVAGRLSAIGAAYGDLPAHDGLWRVSQATAHDLSARLAVVPMVLEARGLDVTPGMIVSLRASGDDDSAVVLQMIYEDELGHVAAGCRWFHYLCDGKKCDPVAEWHRLVRLYFKGDLKAPFNHEGRRLAGFGPEYYEPLAIVRQHTADLGN